MLERCLRIAALEVVFVSTTHSLARERGLPSMLRKWNKERESPAFKVNTLKIAFFAFAWGYLESRAFSLKVNWANLTKKNGDYFHMEAKTIPKLEPHS